MGRVEGKIAIVTGAASGIGRASAILLGQEGARVVITDINDPGGNESAALTGKGAVFLHHDVSAEDDWRSVIGETIARFGRLDILVNNAAFPGAGLTAGPEDTTVEAWLAIHRVTSLGPFLGCKHAIPAMRKSGGGSIVNISSGGALIPSPANTPYGMAKAGVTNLTLTVAIHCALKHDNIRCNAIYPGAVRTPMLEGLFEVQAKQMGVTPDQVAEGFGKVCCPIGRIAQPQDIANAVLFLAADESSYITGAQLVVDGGGQHPTFLALSQ